VSAETSADKTIRDIHLLFHSPTLSQRKRGRADPKRATKAGRWSKQKTPHRSLPPNKVTGNYRSVGRVFDAAEEDFEPAGRA
jgi:hypothetical protein